MIGQRTAAEIRTRRSADGGGDFDSRDRQSDDVRPAYNYIYILGSNIEEYETLLMIKKD
jgi:hypothetical protein